MRWSDASCCLTLVSHVLTPAVCANCQRVSAGIVRASPPHRHTKAGSRGGDNDAQTDSALSPQVEWCCRFSSVWFLSDRKQPEETEKVKMGVGAM